MDLEGYLLNGESCSEFLMLFGRSSGQTKVHYLTIDNVQGKRSRILPMINSVNLDKLKNVVRYSVIALDNYLYILGGKHLESLSCLSHCYRFVSIDRLQNCF